MRNTKKGWMKIFEASIAITLIMGFIVVVYSQNIQRPSASESIIRWQESVLDDIKSDPVFRNAVINNPDIVCDPDKGGLIYKFIRDKILKNFPGFGFSCRVCDLSEACGPLYPPEYRPEIYSEERIISSTLTNFTPKKIKIFLWPLEPEEEIPGPNPDACTDSWATCTWDYQDCSPSINQRVLTCEYTGDCVPPKDPQIQQTIPCIQDTTPPGAVGLSCSGASGNPAPITCTWTEPTDDISGFAKSIAYVNGVARPEIPQSGDERIGITTTATVTIVITVYDNAGNVNQNAGSNTCTIRAVSGPTYIPTCSSP